MALILFALFDTIFVPLGFSFSFKIIFDSMLFKTIDTTVDIIYLIDFILNFFQSYYDIRGFEERDPFNIAKNYMNSNQFKFDVLTIIGSGFVT